MPYNSYYADNTYSVRDILEREMLEEEEDELELCQWNCVAWLTSRLAVARVLGRHICIDMDCGWCLCLF